MSFGDKVWDAFTVLVQMRDTMSTLTESMKRQRERTDNLTERMVRVETTLDLLMKAQQTKRINRE